LKNAYDVISGSKTMDAMIEANARLEESLHKIAEKTAEAAAAYERLGKSAQQVAIMDKGDAASRLQSAQAQLTMLKSMLAAQESVAKQTSPVLGKATTYGPTDAAKAAQEMIPKLQEQIKLNQHVARAVRYQRLPTIAFNGNYGVIGITNGSYHGDFLAEGSMRFPIFNEANQRGQQEVADAQLLALRQQVDEQDAPQQRRDHLRRRRARRVLGRRKGDRQGSAVGHRADQASL